MVVLDGARIEETLGDIHNHGEGWSDAWEGPSDEILPAVRTMLVPAGAVARPGYVVGDTTTQSAHADLLTGARAPFGPLVLGEGTGFFRPELPSLLELAQDQWGGGAVLTHNTVHLIPFAHGSAPGYGEDARVENRFHTEDGEVFEADTLHTLDGDGALSPSPDDGRVVEDIRTLLEDGYRFVFANLHEMDRAGHEHPQTYASHVQRADQPLATLWRWIQSPDSGIADRTLLVVLADHGRHRFGSGDHPWQGHSCACTGCREVPVLLLGPGIGAGVELQDPVILEDLHQTVAWAAGLQSPYGHGRVIEEALLNPSAVVQPQGPRSLTGSGGLLAWQESSGEAHSRHSLVVDGQEHEPADALLTEAPRVLSSDDADYACWRSLTLEPGAIRWPWQAHCVRRELGGDWEDMDLPSFHAGPHFAPSMTLDDQGRLLLAFTNQHSGDEPEDTPHARNMRIRMMRWTAGGGWESADQSSTGGYPLHPALAWHAGHAWVAVAAGEDSDTARYDRQLELHALRWPTGDEAQLAEPRTLSLTDRDGRRYGRHERPALRAADDGLELAVIAWDEEGTHLLAARFDGAMGAPIPIDRSGRVFPHLAPAWTDDGTVVWARLGEQGEVELCAAAGPEGSARCEATGARAIDSLAVGDEGVWLSTSDGDGWWELELWEQLPVDSLQDE